MMQQSEYRAEIDGLRAMAVVAILVFHVNPTWLPGGFVGVDIFFVISGYLITRNILNDVAAGRFSFSRFYYRRARRLLPALFATLVATFVVAIGILPPTEMKSLAASTIYSLVSASNFYFWLHSGYFDVAAGSQPLLHTWSLSVEEQFYLLWPALLLALAKLRPRAKLWVCAALILLGTILATVAAEGAPTAAFYLLPFRAQEFAIGAIIAVASSSRPSSGVASWLGLSLIVVSIAWFDGATPFPSYNALLPCLGTALVIWTGRGTKPAAILSSRPVVYVGKLSYSLYLCHWPIIVLYDLAPTNSDETTRIFSLLAFISAATVALHYMVEKRFRYAAADDRPKRFALLYGVAACIMIAPAANAALGDGWMWRLPGDLRRQIRPVETSQIYQTNNADGRKAFSTSKIKVLIIGDSHQADFFNALNLNSNAISDIEVRSLRLDDACFFLFAKTPGSTPPKMAVQLANQCQDEVSDFQQSERTRASDVIVISTRWDEIGIDHFPDFTNWVRSNLKARLIALGRTMEFKPIPSLLLEHYELREKPPLPAFAASRRNSSIDLMNERLTQLSETLGVPFFRKDGWICSKDHTSCDILDSEGNPNIYDYGHWTLEGAKFYGERIVESPVMAAIRG